MDNCENLYTFTHCFILFTTVFTCFLRIFPLQATKENQMKKQNEIQNAPTMYASLISSPIPCTRLTLFHKHETYVTPFHAIPCTHSPFYTPTIYAFNIYPPPLVLRLFWCKKYTPKAVLTSGARIRLYCISFLVPA